MTKLVTFVMLAFSVPIFAADRPTAEQVAEAVEKSRAEYTKNNPPPTQVERIAQLQEQLRSAQQSLANARRERNRSERAEKLREVNDRIDKIQDELRQVRRKYEPTVEVRLMPIDWNRLEVGSVGRIEDIKGSGVLRCLQRVGDDRFLGQFEYSEPRTTIVTPGGDVRRFGGQQYVKGPYVFVGFDEPAFQQEDGWKRAGDLEADIIVTDTYSYVDVEGAMRTVLVLEAFDPDDPFE